MTPELELEELDMVVVKRKRSNAKCGLNLLIQVRWHVTHNTKAPAPSLASGSEQRMPAL